LGDFEQDFADVLRRFHPPMGLAGVGKRVG
jgi:hypothetical protein